MWLNNNLSIGQTTVGKTVMFSFKNDQPLQKIVNLEVSCGCLKAKENYDNNTILVSYTPNPVPKHLDSDHYISNKYIMLTYKDGTTTKLLFTSTVYKKK